MHFTNTIGTSSLHPPVTPQAMMIVRDVALNRTDYIVLAHGELVFKTHDGESRVVRSGDVVVQVANAHEWLNETDQAARECHRQIAGLVASLFGQSCKESYPSGRRSQGISRVV